MLSSNMLLLNLILLIDVTFSTPTPNFTQNPRRLLLVPRVSFGDVFSNLPPVDQVADVVGRSPLKHKRNFRRPTLLAKDRPDFQQICVPCPRLVYGTNAIGCEHRKDVHGENLNHEMSNNDCYDATLKCFRDAVYPSEGVRQASMKCLNLKTSDPGKGIDRKSARRRLHTSSFTLGVKRYWAALWGRTIKDHRLQDCPPC